MDLKGKNAMYHVCDLGSMFHNATSWPAQMKGRSTVQPVTCRIPQLKIPYWNAWSTLTRPGAIQSDCPVFLGSAVLMLPRRCSGRDVDFTTSSDGTTTVGFAWWRCSV